MKLRTKVVLAWENPSFDQGRATRPSTHRTFTQRKIACCTGTCQTKNADTKEIERVAVDAATQMSVGDTLIWDRLGRSGRASHPTSQHYSPEAKATFHARGVTTKFLPPKGKYFNPLELLFNDLKSHYIRPNFLRNGQALPKSRIEGLIREYVEEKAPTTLPGFFRARANGKHAVINEML